MTTFIPVVEPLAERLALPALLLGSRLHGETGAVVRLLTRDNGVVAAYLPGARGAALRPLLLPGNSLALELRVRGTGMPSARVELVTSRAHVLGDPLSSTALAWVTALSGSALPERQAYPALYDGLSGLLAALAAAPSARGWGPALARYELLLLEQLGFGVDTVAAVQRGRLPAFMGAGGANTPSVADVLAALRTTGLLIERHVYEGRRAAVFEPRLRLIERLKRAVA